MHNRLFAEAKEKSNRFLELEQSFEEKHKNMSPVKRIQTEGDNPGGARSPQPHNRENSLNELKKRLAENRVKYGSRGNRHSVSPRRIEPKNEELLKVLHWNIRADIDSKSLPSDESLICSSIVNHLYLLDPDIIGLN